MHFLEIRTGLYDEGYVIYLLFLYIPKSYGNKALAKKKFKVNNIFCQCTGVGHQYDVSIWHHIFVLTAYSSD